MGRTIISSASTLTGLQLTGQDESHLQALASGHLLHPLAAIEFEKLVLDAREAGFELAVASSFRSFERQCAIWNDKARGGRAVHDDSGRPIAMDELSAAEKLHAIMRFSALPGTSRHHWGSDLDVFDAKAMPANYPLQLSPGEVAPGGLFDPLHLWLDERMACGESRGFFRPYSIDRGGVAPERWHLSYAPLARECERACSKDLLGAVLSGADLELWAEVSGQLPELIKRYVQVPPDWCPEGV
jgi:LAS superfamily LD-carboxypeptidase LdcB